MARPTRAEKDRKRIADLLAEGKDHNGEPIEEGQIISETKDEAKKPLDKNDFSISDLEEDLEKATLGNGGGAEGKPTGSNDITSEDFSAEDKDDPDYVPKSGHDKFRESLIENESDANKAETQPVNNPAGPKTQPTKDFAEPVIQGPGPAEEVKPEEPKRQSRLCLILIRCRQRKKEKLWSYLQTPF